MRKLRDRRGETLTETLCAVLALALAIALLAAMISVASRLERRTEQMADELYHAFSMAEKQANDVPTGASPAKGTVSVKVGDGDEEVNVEVNSTETGSRWCHTGRMPGEARHDSGKAALP